jgi:hypothetical protein
MSSRNDLTFQFIFSDSPGLDMRSFQVNQVFEGSSTQFEMYKVLIRLSPFQRISRLTIDQFYHPHPGSSLMGSASTTFERYNHRMGKWELAGEISWTTYRNAIVIFGIERVSLFSSFIPPMDG